MNSLPLPANTSREKGRAPQVPADCRRGASTADRSRAVVAALKKLRARGHVIFRATAHPNSRYSVDNRPSISIDELIAMAATLPEGRVA